MPATASRHRSAMPLTRSLGRGVRLHLLPTDRFATTYCRILLQRDLGEEAAATAVLASVLESATARHPTREALAFRLADLYGANLRVGVGRIGQRQVISAALEWPTSRALSGGTALRDGLELLGEVWADPLRGPKGALDAELVETERRNLRRTLMAARDDKAAYALRRAVELSCPGQAFSRDPNGRLEQLEGITPASLAALHARLLRTAPVDIYLAGNFRVAEAERAARRALAFPRGARGAAPPAVVSVEEGPARRSRRTEADDVAQGRLVLSWRGSVRPTARALPAAETLAMALGGGPWSRLFKIVREEHGLCYSADATWWAAAGLLVVQTGVDAGNEAKASKLIDLLAAEVMRGVLDPVALQAMHAAAQRQVDLLLDDPRALLGWRAQREALGLSADPLEWQRSLERVRPADVRRIGERLRPSASFFLKPRKGKQT